ncbi:MAG: galactokinase family protein, partial [Bacteroidota bacterium]
MERFDVPQVLTRAPGRINFLGGHTDYNDGFVLPAAVNRYIWLAARFNGTPGKIRCYALDFDSEDEWDLSREWSEKSGWQAYVFGAADLMEKEGFEIKGMDLVVGGNIPKGGGMSSSAALTCGWISTMNALNGWKLEKNEIAKWAQQVEHRYAGVECG